MNNRGNNDDDNNNGVFNGIITSLNDLRTSQENKIKFFYKDSIKMVLGSCLFRFGETNGFSKEIDS